MPSTTLAIIPAVGALLALAACAEPPRPQPSPGELRVVTYNVLGLRGFPARQGGPVAFPEPHPALVTELAGRIAGWRADIVLLQEAPPEAVVRELARQAGMHAAFWSTRGPSGAEWPFGFPGAVLSRFPLTQVQDRAAALRTPADARFHRHWGEATAMTPGGPLRVAGMHLCADWGGVFREEVRLAELEAVSAAPLPDLIAGDFNTRPDAAPWRRMRDAGWRDAWLEAGAAGDGLTSDTRQRIQRIDYLWLAPHCPWRVAAAEVLPDPVLTVDGAEVLLSDHHPVLAVLAPAR
ncbi:MAG: hypothetical protein RLZZ127_2705 [Planctomycetota bacterium]|jgi:endonuclease/exonuclease/phosphatase family metal-dependent hydrolase